MFDLLLRNQKLQLLILVLRIPGRYLLLCLTSLLRRFCSDDPGVVESVLDCRASFNSNFNKVNALMCVCILHSLHQTSHSPNISLPSTRNIGTWSTTETTPTSAAHSNDAVLVPAHPKIPSKSRPNLGAQNGSSNHYHDGQPSHPTSYVRHHRGHKKVSAHVLGRAEGENVIATLEADVALNEEIEGAQGSTSHVCNLEQELEVEGTARKAVDASRVKMEERMQNKLKVVGQQFNSTLQSLHHSIQQICHNVPGFVMPSFTPLSVDDIIEEDDDVEGEENNFEEEHNFDEDE